MNSTTYAECNACKVDILIVGAVAQINETGVEITGNCHVCGSHVHKRVVCDVNIIETAMFEMST